MRAQTFVVFAFVLAFWTGVPCANADMYFLAKALDLSAYFGRVTSCPDGYTSANNVCQCLEGRTGVNCELCPAGTYKDFLGSADCVVCPVDRTSFAGATSADDCLCIEGLFVTATGCEPCPANFYKPAIGNHTACLACPPHSETTATGHTALTDCQCSVGYTGPNGGPCVECPEHTFKSTIGTLTCTACHANSVTVQAASTDAAQCVCTTGHYLNAEVCEPCPVDTYKSSVGNEACTSCSDYPEFNIFGMLYSSTQDQTGSVSICECVCDPGYVAHGNCVYCGPCDADHYCPGGAVTESQPCPPNSHSNPDDLPASTDDCICDAGYWKYGTVCNVCTADYFCDGVLGTRQRCPDNSTAPVMSVSEENCTCVSGFEKQNDV